MLSQDPLGVEFTGSTLLRFASPTGGGGSQKGGGGWIEIRGVRGGLGGGGQRNPRGGWGERNSEGMQLFLLTIGNLLLTPELFCLQLCLGVFLIII